MKSLGHEPTDTELQEMISELATKKRSTFNFSEFLSLIAFKIKETESEEEFREAFSMFDKDGKGFISISDLRQVIDLIGKKMSDEELNEMIREADTDGDGLINCEGHKICYCLNVVCT